MKYVRQFGSIWELPEHKFKELLETGAKGKSYKLNHLIGTIQTSSRSYKTIFKRRKSKRPELELELIKVLMAICQRHPSKTTDRSM
jgi:hypothetical protein